MNILCRHCFQLFDDRRMAVLCRSARCSQTVDEQGRRGPRFMLPRNEGLWSRWRRRIELDAPCPYCEEVGRLVPACPRCRRPLDAEVGETEDRLIAVIGARDAGKTHYLATVFYQFLEGGIGDDEWQVEIDAASRREFELRFRRPLFEELRELEATPPRPGPELRLVLVNRRDGRRVLLAFRDLSGEVLRDPERLAEVDFLRYAQGVVLLADPLAFAPPATGGRRRGLYHDEPDCAQILEVYRQVLESRPRYPGEGELALLPAQKFLAVAVTKADLFLARDHAFWQESNGAPYLAPGFWEERREPSREAQEWLGRRLGGELAAAAEAFADVSYFFVSSYGYAHTPHVSRLRKPPAPLRVHEPIFALLDRFAVAAPSEELEEL